MNSSRRWQWRISCGIVVGLALASMVGVFLAPAEQTMGDAQRILYVHVSVAWFSLIGVIVMSVSGVMYLLRRDLWWDYWAGAAAEVGWLCAALTVVTGSLWAHAAWNTWWTWDPRLMTSFVLWLIYSGYLLVRNGVDDAHRCARLSSILAIVGMADVPLVTMATRWFRSIHPTTPIMDPSMHLVLLLNVLSFTAMFGLLLVARRSQMQTSHRLTRLEHLADW